MPKTCACRQHTPGVGYFPFNVCVMLVQIRHFAWTTRAKGQSARLEAANLPPTPTVSKERAERWCTQSFFHRAFILGTTVAPTPFLKKKISNPPSSFNQHRNGKMEQVHLVSTMKTGNKETNTHCMVLQVPLQLV